LGRRCRRACWGPRCGIAVVVGTSNPVPREPTTGGGCPMSSGTGGAPARPCRAGRTPVPAGLGRCGRRAAPAARLRILQNRSPGLGTGRADGRGARHARQPVEFKRKGGTRLLDILVRTFDARPAQPPCAPDLWIRLGPVCKPGPGRSFGPRSFTAPGTNRHRPVVTAGPRCSPRALGAPERGRARRGDAPARRWAEPGCRFCNGGLSPDPYGGPR